MDTCGTLGRVREPAELVETALRICEQRGQRFTPVRRNVFAIVARSTQPITAYQILDRLLDSGRESGPPTVYRALEFLIRQHLVHRVESLNAYVACTRPEEHHDCQFLICTDCGTTAEVPSGNVLARLSAAARGAGFSVNAAVVELKGLCAHCRRALGALVPGGRGGPAP